jgi:tripartite-type tricarboxylate transporter receptor subunit TctC
MIRVRLIAYPLCAAMTCGACLASGNDFPNKTIRIVASPPGGNSDFFTRLIAQGLTTSLGQTVILDLRNIEINVQRKDSETAVANWQSSAGR